MKIAVISLSGGMDSSSLLAESIGHYDKIFTFAFDYGQRHRIELEKAVELVEFVKSRGWDIQHQIINVRDVFDMSQSALGTSQAQDVPKEEYNAENLSATVVENRNVIFSACIYSKALAISKKFDADVDIMLGVHSNDNSVYPDCRPESVELSKVLYKISNYGSERIEYKSPFINATKAEVLARGLKGLEYAGIPADEFYSHTLSCYDPVDGKSCGKCATCRDRLQAFVENGIQDPIPYI